MSRKWSTLVYDIPPGAPPVPESFRTVRLEVARKEVYISIEHLLNFVSDVRSIEQSLSEADRAGVQFWYSAGGDCFVPTSWMSREFPQTASLCRDMEHRIFTAALESGDFR